MLCLPASVRILWPLSTSSSKATLFLLRGNLQVPKRRDLFLFPKNVCLESRKIPVPFLRSHCPTQSIQSMAFRSSSSGNSVWIGSMELLSHECVWSSMQPSYTPHGNTFCVTCQPGRWHCCAHVTCFLLHIPGLTAIFRVGLECIALIPLLLTEASSWLVYLGFVTPKGTRIPVDYFLGQLYLGEAPGSGWLFVLHFQKDPQPPLMQVSRVLTFNKDP